ncbi:hypothetical protein CALCODRAFT_507472 [Calocera cornea HHB12733]|uniref:Uncharacterized protein n=1 Tax=Calocera cornea HHB12733 TaxID=1353952 RepID=A0A165HQJ8_9BASI|nr:hypothetical protein CALCODRAFT_507472 [Calocera cornea HHB12733]
MANTILLELGSSYPNVPSELSLLQVTREHVEILLEVAPFIRPSLLQEQHILTLTQEMYVRLFHDNAFKYPSDPPAVARLGLAAPHYFVSAVSYLVVRVRYALANARDMEDGSTPTPVPHASVPTVPGSPPFNPTTQPSPSEAVELFDYEDFYYTIVAWFLDNWTDEAAKGIHQFWVTRISVAR